MNLPLQPDLRAQHPAWRRWALLLALALAVLLLGLFAPRPAPAPLLLLNDGELRYHAELLRRIGLARERIWVAMFVIRREDHGPDAVTAVVEALAAARHRGVDVRVALDRGTVWNTDEPDSKHVAPAAWLHERGVRVVIDELERTTHSKIVLIDGDCAIVGSHNWTYSALRNNREASLLTSDRTVVAGLEQFFQTIPGWEQAPSPE